jgi:hypothetical protein
VALRDGEAGVRLDSQRRYRSGRPKRAPEASEAVRRYLRFYGPGTATDFGEWAGLAKPHGPPAVGRGRGRARRGQGGQESGVDPRRGRGGARVAPGGVRHPPPPAGRSVSAEAHRPLLAREAELRKRLFRPVASPGAVLRDGRLAGLWRAKAKGKKTEITVEKLARLARGDVEEEAQRVARVRGAAEAVLVLE